VSRALLLLALLLPAACGEQAPRPAPEPEAGEAECHGHQPQRGGRLVEIGRHVAQVEIVHDRVAGTLTAYVMDGHASRAVRLPAKSLRVRIEVGGEELTFDLKPVADPLTGETVGDTSRFEVRADLFERIRAFAGVIVELTVFDRVFRDVAFTYGPE
jgi:hypothetical protein